MYLGMQSTLGDTGSLMHILIMSLTRFSFSMKLSLCSLSKNNVNMFSDLPSEDKNDFKNPKYSFTQPIIYDASTEHSNTGWVDVQAVTFTKY